MPENVGAVLKELEKKKSFILIPIDLCHRNVGAVLKELGEKKFYL